MLAKQRRREGEKAQKLASGSLEGECRHEVLQVLRQQGPHRQGLQAGYQAFAGTKSKRRKRVSNVPGLFSTSPAVSRSYSEACTS